MAGSEASARHTGPAAEAVEANEREKMRSVAQGLLTGIDNLLKGQVYQGTAEEDCVGNDEPSSRGMREHKDTQESAGSSSRRVIRKSLDARLLRKFTETQAETGAHPHDSPQSSKETSVSGSESSWDNESDGFLFYNKQEIAEAAEDDDDKARMERAQMAQRRIMLLLRRLNIDERVDLVDEVCTWYRDRYADAVRSVGHLTFQEDFREQMLGKATDTMLELQEAVTKKEMSVLVKLNEFVANLKGRSEACREYEARAAELRDLRTQEEEKSRIKLLEKLSREDLLLKKYLDIKDKTEKAKHELELVNKQLGVEETKLTSQLTRATKASDLLEIIARQQEEITALNAKAALTSQRTTMLQSCIASTGARKAEKLSTTDHSREQAAEEALKEIKQDVLQEKIAEHMRSDANFCREVWKSMNPKLTRMRSGELAKEEQQKQLLAECDQLQAEIDRLAVLKHSGRLEEEVADLVAARKAAAESSMMSSQVT